MKRKSGTLVISDAGAVRYKIIKNTQYKWMGLTKAAALQVAASVSADTQAAGSEIKITVSEVIPKLNVYEVNADVNETPDFGWNTTWSDT